MRTFSLSLASIAAAAVLVSCGSKLNQDKPDAAAETPKYEVYAADADKDAVNPLEPKPVALQEALRPERMNTKQRVEARVEEVCQVKGCWMILTDGTNSVRVTFRDYGFFVPKDIAGQTVVVDGVVAETVLSEADARHYAEDAGKSEEEINAIVGDQKELSIEADAVLIAAR